MNKINDKQIYKLIFDEMHEKINSYMNNFRTLFLEMICLPSPIT